MSEPIFNDKNNQPTDKLLVEKLGKSFKYWSEIREHVNANYENTKEEWKFYGKKYGWQLKTFLKKRNLFFLIPAEASFKIGFVFGDKAVEEIKKSKISADLVETVVNVKKYMEGRGLPIDVKAKKYLPDIKKLIEIKVKN